MSLRVLILGGYGTFGGRLARLLAGIGSFDANLAWEPQHGTEVIVVPLASPDKPIRFEVPPFFQWHFVNAWEEGDETLGKVAASDPRAALRMPSSRIMVSWKEAMSACCVRNWATARTLGRHGAARPPRSAPRASPRAGTRRTRRRRSRATCRG